MDEASQTLHDGPIALQGLPAGAVMTEAKRLARNAVKAQWQAEGRKVPWEVDPRELAEATSAYLDTHRAELVNQARANLSNYVQRRKP